MKFRGVKSGYVVEVGYCGPLFELLQSEGIIKRIEDTPAPAPKLKPDTTWRLQTSPTSGELWLLGTCRSCGATHRITGSQETGRAKGTQPFWHCGVSELPPGELILELQARYRAPEPVK